MKRIMTYIITEEEAFHDEPTESTLKAAQRTIIKISESDYQAIYERYTALSNG